MTKPHTTRRSSNQLYSLNQCALYKVNSKRRLAQILGVDLALLRKLSRDEGSYNVFEIPEEICSFTGKKTKARLVQNPVPELKAVHKRIHALLSRVCMPDFCHGSVKGRSYRSNAAAHVTQPVVATFDLKSFFPSTLAYQVFGFYRNELQCSPDVAGLLTDLCTYRKMLPTGSPVSPVLSFWANRNLFNTLNKRAQEQHLKLSVYVDDITVSGQNISNSLSSQFAGIVSKHGHGLAHEKTKVFAEEDVKHVTGIAIKNGKLRVPYSRFKKARAIRQAINESLDDIEKEKLIAKLCGLLGEAAFIDKSFKTWADQAYESLAQIKRKRTPS